MNNVESLFKDIKLPADRIGQRIQGKTVQGKTVYDKIVARIFTIRAIRLKGSITRTKLRILLNNHDAAQYLDEILDEILNSAVQDGDNSGFITESGDGIKGLLGKGPITYHWQTKGPALRGQAAKETNPGKDKK